MFCFDFLFLYYSLESILGQKFEVNVEFFLRVFFFYVFKFCVVCCLIFMYIYEENKFYFIYFSMVRGLKYFWIFLKVLQERVYVNEIVVGFIYRNCKVIDFIQNYVLWQFFIDVELLGCCGR